MDQGKKKAFYIKVRSVNRTLKEFKSYKNQVDAYDLNVVSQDKKKQEFYLESKSTLQNVQKNLIEFYSQLNTFIDENKQQIIDQEDQQIKQHHETAKQAISQIKTLLPADV